MADSDRIADYKLQIAFGGGIGGRFTIGTSELDGTDIITSDWTTFFTGTYDDVTLDVAEGSQVAVSRGWDSLLSGLQTGRISFSLFNAASPSLYDPNDSTSPIYGGTLDPGFVPMRPVRLQASTDAWVTTEGVIYAFIRDASYDPISGVCSIQAEDLLFWLQRLENPVIPLASGLTSADIVGKILDAIGFTDTAFRSLTTTPALTGLTFEADGSKSAYTLLGEILDAEQGRCFVDGSGVFHFEDRYARDRVTSASYSFTTELVDVDSRASADSVRNRVAVTATGGTARIAQDDASIHDFGIGDAASISTDYLASDLDADALARLILKRIKDPLAPKQTTIDNQTLTVMNAQLGVELSNRVTVSGADCYVERIDHTIEAGGIGHSTTLLVTKAPDDVAFQIGVSALVDPAATVGDYIAA